MNNFKFIFPIFLIFFISCNRGTFDPSAPQPGTYVYKAFDSTGILIVEGWLKFKVDDSIQPDDDMNYLPIEGVWHLNKIGNPGHIGDQVGDGILKGTIEDDKIWINLNPGWADNNVYLNGKLDGNKFDGEWFYSTFVGAINGGPFQYRKL